MSTSSIAVPEYSATAVLRAVNPWFVALAVVIPTFMEVLDTTIANVALRHIAGGLSAAVTDGEWVITSYLAANAIILPISGWLSIRLGRRNYFLLSILVFTVASALCGMATSLNMLIFSRVLQGLAGGGLQPSSQAVLLDAFPKEKQGTAQTAFSIAALLAPVVGPTLGGYVTDNYGWRWVFYINVPVGLLALVMCNALVFDPPYLKAQSAEARRQNRAFDTLGLSLLAVTMTSWEVLVSKGQEWDWFGDPFLRVQGLALLFVLGLVGLIIRERRYDNPLINFRTLKDPNFRVCCMIIFCAFATLYANSVSLPALLQSLFGYDATTSGLVLSPAAIFSIIMLVIVGWLLGRGVDARYLMAAGLFVMSVASYWISRLNLGIGPWQIIWPRVVFIIGLSTIFAPLNVAAFLNIPPQLRGAAVGLLALLRNEGGSVGISVAQTIHERRDQFHSLRLGENLDRLNPAVNSYLHQVEPVFLQQTGDPVAAKQMALQTLANLREQQSSALAYFDTFFIFAVVAVALIALVFFMKRSIAAKGPHVAAE
jgi:MFS transporter, DHA2 family, multidrug resistance protein